VTLAPLTARHLATADAGPYTELERTLLKPAEFFSMLDNNGVDFFAGVPDSLLKDFCAYATDHVAPENHLITANEGAAVAYATGYHLATGGLPCVYMQNSGIGNTVNPLLSLSDPRVYSIPTLMLVGWRGEPGHKDEPQHVAQGELTPGLLAAMGVPFQILPDFKEGAEHAVTDAVKYMRKRKSPFALLVKKGTFDTYKLVKQMESPYAVSREEFLGMALSSLDDWDAVVSTTGFTSREVFELREAASQDHSRDFLTVGSMGHASAIALGIAVSKPSRQVYCLDGDGAMLMHMGAF
jgi:phosphonopyruvate decarboxylase